MKKFSKKDRNRSMINVVSFHDVPMPRGVAFMLNHIEEHGGKMYIWSADRRDAIIAEHNKQFGTNLHGQQWLVDMYARFPGNYAPANSPQTTSHCYRSDGNVHYRDSRGRYIRSGDRIPWYMVGLDVEDKNDNDGRTGNDVDRILRVGHNLGYDLVRPYLVGSEGHHIICTESPIKTLENWNVIAKERHA